MSARLRTRLFRLLWRLLRAPLDRAGVRARGVAQQPDFWEVGELAHEELTRRIRCAGGVTPEHALEALQLISGEILLVHGCHRWAVAAELCRPSVPVKMDFEVQAIDE